jgi:hypothetical protein
MVVVEGLRVWIQRDGYVHLTRWEMGDADVRGVEGGRVERWEG